MNLDDVLALAGHGLRVMPLHPQNKIPILKDWQVKATTDERTITQWFKLHKTGNWGVVTGGESGVFVIDLDPGKGGDKAWAKLVKSQGNGVPRTVTTLTGGGGTHYYFKYPKSAEIRNSASKLAKGVDVRGDGGQVVAAGSIHPNGTPYRWKDGCSPDEVEFAKPPKWLLQLVEQAGRSAGDGGQIGDPLEKGERNNSIYHQALYLARQGALQEVTLAAMVAWCESTGETDVPRGEIEATVASAYKKASEEDHTRVSNEELELSDTGNAQRLIRGFGDTIRYVPSLGWHVWSGKHWRRDQEELHITKLAIDTVDQVKNDIAEQLKVTTDRAKAAGLIRTLNWMVGSHNAGRLAAMADTAKAFPEVKRDVAEMDGEDTLFLLNCANGTLDLRTGELHPHDPANFITRLANVDYSPKAKCPLWLQTLQYAFNGDRELISYFQRAIGYTLSGALSEQCFFICWGESGNNGKSTMMMTLERMLGEDYAVTTDARVISSKDKDNHVFSSLAALNQVRMVSVNEIGETAQLDEELIKQLTGGDTIQAKRLYMEPFTYRPTFKIWVRANNKPMVRGNGEAFWRRVKLIPFLHPIPADKRRARHEVDAELKTEWPGILAWAVRGFQDWYANGGLRDPQAVSAAGNEYRESSDVIAQFLSECTEAGDTISRKTLYDAFKAWHDDQGLRFPPSMMKFSSKIADRLDQHGKTYSNRVVVWKGVKLTDEAQLNYAMVS